ncbi:MAG: DJ-1 family glyoxalase III [Cyanobacteria bacterium J06648_11]
MVRVLLPLVEGFEEIEAIATVDILRRAEVDTVVAAVASESGSLICGSHGICVKPDTYWDELDATVADDFDAIAVPGGPGVKTLLQRPEIVELTRAFHEREKTVAAICAAPLVLSEAGILRDRTATSFPSVRDRIDSDTYSTERVVLDGNILTSRGAGTAVEFALQLVATLVGEDKAKAVGDAIVSNWSPLPLPVS